MRLLIGAGISKINYMKKFSEYLENSGVNCKLVLDDEFSKGFPSKSVRHWLEPSKKFNLLKETFKPDFVFVDRQTHFGVHAIKSNIPLLVYLRGDYWKELEWAKKNESYKNKILLSIREKIAHECFMGSSMILPFSNYLSSIVQEKYPDKNIQILHDGLDPKEWQKGKSMELKHPCIGLVQNVSIWIKTEEMLMLKQILTEFPHVTFYWVGDGIYRKKILEWLGHFENFKWLGFLEYPHKVKEFYNSIDAYLLLSGYDSFGMTALEAQIMECPVIITNIGGTKETVIHNKTGFLVNKGDIHEYCDKINLLLNDRKLANSMGIEGKKFVLKNFDWEKSTKDFINLLKQI